HLHEAEPLGTAGVAVHDHLGRLHGAVRLKQALQVTVGHPVSQVADVQLLAHEGPPEKERMGRAAAPDGRTVLPGTRLNRRTELIPFYRQFLWDRDKRMEG